MRAGELLREARRRAHLSQVELATRAGVTQSVISVYESGRRQPSVPTLMALVAATGHRLDLRVEPELDRLSGPRGQSLQTHLADLHRIAGAHGVTIQGVFGSVARGEDQVSSDIDLLVDLPANMGLLGLGRLAEQLEVLLGGRVDLVPATDLKPGVRTAVYRDLVRL